jgi:hypothetical protein
VHRKGPLRCTAGVTGPVRNFGPREGCYRDGGGMPQSQVTASLVAYFFPRGGVSKECLRSVNPAAAHSPNPCSPWPAITPPRLWDFHPAEVHRRYTRGTPNPLLSVYRRTSSRISCHPELQLGVFAEIGLYDTCSTQLPYSTEAGLTGCPAIPMPLSDISGAVRRIRLIDVVRM